MTLLQHSELITLERGPYTEYWIRSPKKLLDVQESIRTIFEFLQTSGADVVSARLFGNGESLKTAAGLIDSLMGNMAIPPVKLLQNDINGSDGLEVQVYAVSGTTTQPVYLGGDCVGRSFQDRYARYFWFNVLPENPLDTPYAQTKSVYSKALRILGNLGLTFSNTLRTWLFASDILSWYDQLNQARNEFFETHGVYDRLVPASTGIGLDNPSDALLTTQFLAVEPLSDEVTIQQAASPLQNSAMDYKSAFSRAVTLTAPDHCRLSISGTASIDKSGKTVFLDDIDAQIDLTMRVVEAILQEAGMEWSDTACAQAYFKHAKDFGRFDAYCRTHLVQLPVVKLQADVCRDDLLFELELDAVKLM